MIKKFRGKSFYLNNNSNFLKKRALMNYEQILYDSIDDLKQGSTVVDIGAAEGLFNYLFKKK